MDEKSKLNDELVAEFKQEPEILDMTPLESIKSLVRQALGYEELSPMDLTKHISVALRSSTGSNAIVEREEGSEILQFFAAGEYPATSLKVSIVPVQEGSGDPSPDNVRPISGWTGANVYRAGKNLIPASLSVSDLYPTRPGGGVCISATAYRTFACPIPAGASEITWSKNATMGGYLALSDALPTVGAPCETEIIVTNRNALTFSTPKRKYLLISVPTSEVGTTEDLRALITQYEYCVNVGGSVDTGAPSDALTIPITFPTPPGTVYGGTLDVVTGVLTVTHAGVDIESLSWSTRYSGSSNKTLSANLPSTYYGFERGSKGPPFRSEVFVVVQSVNGVASLSNPDSKDVGLYWLSNASSRETSVIYIVMDTNDSPTGLIVYELATPVTYQLDPEELSTLTTLIGENNIWADCGPVESITY